MLNLIESLLRGISATGIADAFIVSIFLTLAISLYLKRSNRGQGFTHYAPTLLTTLGILGTFAGIIVGLLDFDVNKIEQSIPALLAGLKTAFITSLIGMLASIFYKVLVSSGYLTKAVDPALDEDQIGATDIYAAIVRQADEMAVLSKAIGGEEDSSLLSQIKLMRADITDNHKSSQRVRELMGTTLVDIQNDVAAQQAEFKEFQERLWRNLQDFADMLSKSATETVINALKDVIKDFNNNLTEQFGENFKQLNAAVEKLVEWQENYKGQISDMTAQYAQGVQAITATEQSMEKISERAGTIPETMERLQTVVEVNQHQINELDRHLTAFSDVRDRAVEAVPEIRKQIDETIAGAQQVNQEITTGMQGVAESVQKVMSDSAEQSAKQIADSASTLSQAIATGAEEFVANSHGVNASLQSTSDVLQQHSHESRQTLQDALEEVNASMRALVTDMKTETEQVNKKFADVGESVIREAGAVQKTMTANAQELMDSVRQAFEEAAQRQTEAHQRVLSGLSQQADKALADTGESVTKQVNALDRALEREMNQVMTEMGRALARISGQFTSDYSKLVKEMDNVVRRTAGAA
ncbi:membrane protein [Bacterioplanes sanyensis]|uniref:MotA/TolQ/ExbB proton channel family protein n=1 Tax=Bacterioplanes sanyensis TaxID=1249553 RepID=UPI0016723DC8|nr:MotA/TolQ/ExbB proton channel family protein [Bacterioplanes sanyensis]GGY39032.1 membrane protein [Bacterioplanes sanyensis]